MSDRLLVLVRHGESEWNLKNLFTGWKDPDLTEKGVKEATEAGRKLKSKGLSFDVAFTSVLQRAQHTLDLILSDRIVVRRGLGVDAACVGRGKQHLAFVLPTSPECGARDEGLLLLVRLRIGIGQNVPRLRGIRGDRKLIDQRGIDLVQLGKELPAAILELAQAGREPFECGDIIGCRNADIRCRFVQPL